MPDEPALSDRPADYLKDGWRDPDGRLRKPLAGLAAFAAAQRLQRADIPPGWPGAVLAALRETLPRTDGPAEERLAAALEESLETVSAMIDQESPDALDDWLAECAEHVHDAADLDSFLAHLEAVTRQYAALAAVSTADPSS